MCFADVLRTSLILPGKICSIYIFKSYVQQQENLAAEINLSKQMSTCLLTRGLFWISQC